MAAGKKPHRNGRGGHEVGELINGRRLVAYHGRDSAARAHLWMWECGDCGEVNGPSRIDSIRRGGPCSQCVERHYVPPRERKRRPPTVCSIDGCDSPIIARGWCSAHYMRWYRYGDVDDSALIRQRILGFVHGRYSSYTKGGCRCELCCQAACDYRSRPHVMESRREYARQPHILERRRQYAQEHPREGWYVPSPEARAAAEEYRSSHGGRTVRRRWAEKKAAIPGPRNGPWLPGEIAIAMHEDLDITEVCFLLQRSYSSVKGLRFRMGYGTTEKSA